jgi:hypothetical protein
MYATCLNIFALLLRSLMLGLLLSRLLSYRGHTQFVLQTLETRGFHFNYEHVTAGMRSGDKGVCDLAADRFTDTTAKRSAATLTPKLTTGAAATYGQTFRVHECVLCVQSIRAFQMEFLLKPKEELFNCP